MPGYETTFTNNLNEKQGLNKIQLFDVTGKVVCTNKEVRQTESIDLRGFKSGLYIVLVQTADNIYTTKVIIEQHSIISGFNEH